MKSFWAYVYFQSEVFDPDKFRNPDYYSPERRNKEAFGLRNEEHLARFKKELGDIGATLYASEEEMAGKERFVVDDLLSADQCEVLRDLAKVRYACISYLMLDNIQLAFLCNSAA